MIRIDIQATDTATPALAALVRRGNDKAGLHGAVAEAEEDLFRQHLAAEARVRHTTAQRLGAAPTGELEKAAMSPEGTATSQGARITIGPRYLFARAFRDVTILPTGGKKYLTIPIAARSYGRRIRDFAKGDRKGLFAFVPRVRQRQDRTLLPSDDGMLAAAEEGAKDYLLATEKGGAA